MNGFKITYQGKEYVTNADTFEDAEKKFIEEYNLVDDYSYTIEQDTAENLKDLKATFF